MSAPRVMRCLCGNLRSVRPSWRPSRVTETMHRQSQRALPSKVTLRYYTRPAKSRKEILKQAYKEHPVLLPAGFVAVFLSFCMLGYVNYLYFMQEKAVHNFPEPVAKELRKAMYYQGMGKDPKKAMQHWKEALMVATDIEMNPLSQEFIGMRIGFAEFLEKNGLYRPAIQLLEKERQFCYDTLEEARTKEKEEDSFKIPSHIWSRMTSMAVKTGIKLGKLYASDEIDDPESAQEAFVLAVETLLRERKRRQEGGITEDSDEWLNEEEIGASLEELGHTYLEDTKQPELALPLYLQALSLCPPKSCHAAMLMNQVSAALSAQEPGAAPLLSPATEGTKLPKQTFQDLQKQAKQWAEKALAMAQTIDPPERTQECDIACAVITHNLAELAHMSGDIISAKQLFSEAKAISKAVGFQDGVVEATQALRSLEEPSAT